MSYTETKIFYQKGKEIARHESGGYDKIKDIKKYISYIKEKGIPFYLGNSWLSPYFDEKPENFKDFKYLIKEKKLNITFKDSKNSIRILFIKK